MRSLNIGGPKAILITRASTLRNWSHWRHDVIVAQGASAVRAISQATRTLPIVFPVAGDPVGAGLVETLARPGGSVTGFMNFEYSTSAKWLELLKEIAPSVAR